MGAKKQRASPLLIPTSPDARHNAVAFQFSPLTHELRPVSVTGAFGADTPSLVRSVTTLPPLVGRMGARESAGVGWGVTSSRTTNTQMEEDDGQQPHPVAQHSCGLGRGNNPLNCEVR